MLSSSGSGGLEIVQEIWEPPLIRGKFTSLREKHRLGWIPRISRFLRRELGAPSTSLPKDLRFCLARPPLDGDLVSKGRIRRIVRTSTFVISTDLEDFCLFSSPRARAASISAQAFGSTKHPPPPVDNEADPVGSHRKSREPGVVPFSGQFLRKFCGTLRRLSFCQHSDQQLFVENCGDMFFSHPVKCPTVFVEICGYDESTQTSRKQTCGNPEA